MEHLHEIQGPIMEFKGRTAGFTLLEIASVMVVIGILATLSVPMYSSIRGMVEAKQCEANLKGLGIGMNAYLADHGTWPQIPPDLRQAQGSAVGTTKEAQANSPAGKWIAALAGYGIPEKTWHCPSITRQIALGTNPEATKYKRLDYIPTNFSAQDNPRLWPTHPWFIERGSAHGRGPNLLLTDGTVTNVDQLFQRNKLTGAGTQDTRPPQ